MHAEIDLNVAADDVAEAPGNRASRRFAYVRAAVLCLLGFALTVAVITQSFPAYLAEFKPSRALAFNSRQPAALLNLADRALQDIAATEAGTATPAPDSTGKTAAAVPALTPAEAAAAKAAKLDQARTWARQALLQTPFNARALAVLGQAEIAAGDTRKAKQFMLAATQLSIREAGATYWMLANSFEQKDIAATLKYADIALRTAAQMPPIVVPILAQLAQTKAGNSELKTLLAGNPPWRKRFMELLPGSVTDARVPLDLLLYLKDTEHPPTNADLNGYLDVLIANKLYDLAYYTWLQFLPADDLSSLGLLYNGSFESPSTGLPFDWQLPPGTGVTVQIANRTDAGGGNALRILFSQGRATFSGASQMIVLSPGRYRFEGLFLGDLIGRRGLQWKVACVGTPAVPIGASRLFNSAVAAWTKFDFAFAVPASGCPAQVVQLILDARSESEKLVTGVAWYDELRITRVEEAKPQ